MKHCLLCIAVISILAGPAGVSATPGPAGQETGAPGSAAIAATGKEIFAVACVQCHATSHTTIQRKSSERWRKTIYTMIARGAPVLPNEVEPLTAYLTATYGPASRPPVLEGITPREQTLPEGGEIIVRSCGGCHATNLILGARKSRGGWRETVRQMRLNGASLTDSEEQAIVNYLAEHFRL